MITGVDHVVILVNDLEEGIRQYQQLGFTVTPGGKHPRYTHNALVSFDDGTYLELLAFYEQAAAGEEPHRWSRHQTTGGGLIDFAVASDDLAGDVAGLKQRGLDYAGPSDGARQRLDGQQIAWKTAAPQGDNVGALPFVIQDVTNRGLRVPGGEATQHANGVRGIRSLAIATRDVAAASKRYGALLDKQQPDGEHLPTFFDADGVYYLIGPQSVDLAQPTRAGDVQSLLDRRGDSLFELALLGPATIDIDPGQAGNARVRIVAG